MRYRPTFILLAAALACAPATAALAQRPSASAPLVAHTGSPVAYRIGLPKGWELASDGEVTAAVGDRGMVLVFAQDGMDDEDVRDLPVSEAEARRLMTSVLLGSDSLLFGLMGEVLKGIKKEGGSFTEAVRDVRTLGGQRAGYLSVRSDGFLDEPARLEVWFTVKDGYLYLLVFAAADSEYARHQPLFARVRDSLAFAGAAVAAATPD